MNARYHELAGLGCETGDEDYDWLLGEVRAQLSMYRMADEVANRCVDASEALSGLAPIWLPTSALTVASAATEVAGQNTFGLAGLLPKGLMVFAKPFVKAGEVYECDCPQTPDVDVDAVLWWTAEPGTTGWSTTVSTKGRSTRSWRWWRWLVGVAHIRRGMRIGRRRP